MMETTNLNQTRLLDAEWWALPAPPQFLEVLGLKPETSRSAAFEYALEKLADQAPADPVFDQLREIFLEVEVFLEPERKDWLRSIGLLRRAPKAGEFRPMTRQQHNAERRADAELLGKFDEMDRSDAPAREHAARLVADLARRARATGEERAELERRGLLDPDFDAGGRIQ
jgi:hypothetical protein